MYDEATLGKGADPEVGVANTVRRSGWYFIMMMMINRTPVKQLKGQALEYVVLNSDGSIQLIRGLGYSKGIN